MDNQFHNFIPLVSYPETKTLIEIDKLKFKKPFELKGFLDFVHETGMSDLKRNLLKHLI